MSTTLPSTKLTDIFDSLPPEAQRNLIEKHLFTLLDSLPKDTSDNVLSVATEFQTRVRPMPKLDLKAKKKEVNLLMEDLSRDAKTAITKDRSTREELLAEVVDSLIDWLSDIWSTVYEFNDCFAQAHVCLLFVADVSSTLSDLPGLAGSPDSDGLDDGDEFDELGLEAIDEDDDEDDDYVEDDDEIDGDCDDGHSGPHCLCPFHAKHWPNHINEQRIRLRELVEDRLHANYQTKPSLHIYQVLCAISNDLPATERRLLQETNENATKSADTVVGALEVYATLANNHKIAGLLNSHYHLLRARDADVLQKAVRVLLNSGYTVRSMQIMEEELFESIRAIQSALSSIFGNINLPVHKSELDGILKLRAGTQERHDRGHDWVDAVVTVAAPMTPMAFAAMMMGFPLGGPMEDAGQEDVTAFLDDVDPLDPDFEEVNAEFRPKLRERFEGWYKLIERLKEPPAPILLGAMYHKVVELMPFMRGSDIVDQMVLRLTELQGKAYIARALQALSNFCIIQRKKISANAVKLRRASEKAAASGSQNTPTAMPNAPFSFSLHQPPPPPPPPHPTFGGMEDVD
ncbi:hypothetical protein DXG03_006593 [Asterophora parasitica]|uniref:Uncharacterized protein n=1 Tax=Asterophora parasitica TaxID=117018 RepID=A0A9P7G8P4_9AGAR|nr:hypothetical protein DXG03_006593 [Asterophora parasitica]